MYHSSLRHPGTNERTIEVTQTTIELPPAQKLAAKITSIQMILHGNPPEALQEKCIGELVAVLRFLESDYPADLLAARREEFIERVEKLVVPAQGG